MKILFRRGFTLMEVLAGLAIISIVSSIALPGIANFFSGMQVKAEGEIFVQNVRLARYKAIEDQAVYRIIFDTDPLVETPSAYRVQTHLAFDPELGIVYGVGVAGAFEALNYSSDNWADIAEEEFPFDTGSEIVTDLPQALYFWPDGQIYDTADTSQPASTIPEHYIGFVYGSSGIKVIVNCMGVFSSESYAADMVNIADDTEVW